MDRRKLSGNPANAGNSRAAGAAKRAPSPPLPSVEDETATDVDPPRSFLDEAFEQTVERLKADMPLIMHGSGDVEPAKVNGQAAHFLASLTAQYTAHLVDAAVDTFSMFLPQDEPLRVPPPPFQQHRMPAEPQPLLDRKPALPTIMTKGNLERKPPRKRPKRNMREEYWDDPLPAPKIRTKESSAAAASSAKKKRRGGILDDDSDEDEAASTTTTPKNVPFDESWVGAIGVDMHSDSIRRSHMPLALSTPSFIFPICHDVYAYGKVRHIQAAKRSLDPLLLQDSHFADVLQEEKLSRFKKSSAKTAAAAANEQEQEEVEKAMDPASWPDMEELLFPGFNPDLGSTEK